MVETEADVDDRYQLRSTIAYLGRIENQLAKIMEILQHQEMRIGRIERDAGEGKRDMGELKSDVKLMKTTMVSATSEILSLVMRIEEQQQRQQAEARS